MKLLRFLLLYAFISHLNLRAQEPVLDSLKQRLKTSKNDRLKVELLLHIAKEYPYKDPDTCIIFATQALELAKSINDGIGIGQSYTFIGWCHYFKGNYPLSLDYSFKAMTVWDKLLNDASFKQRIFAIKNKSSTLNNIGTVYYDRNELKRR